MQGQGGRSDDQGQNWLGAEQAACRNGGADQGESNKHIMIAAVAPTQQRTNRPGDDVVALEGVAQREADGAGRCTTVRLSGGILGSSLEAGFQVLRPTAAVRERAAKLAAECLRTVVVHGAAALEMIHEDLTRGLGDDAS